MPALLGAADIPTLFTQHTPLLDVRAPVEFARGAFPNAVNLPLLNDAEREIIGKTYKASGQQAAITKGHELVSGDEKARRVQAWQDWIAQQDGAVLYCYRGGLRSSIAQSWLADAGVEIPRIQGGYKRMRRELINTIEAASQYELMVVAGKTGSGKTHLINELQYSVDLEGLANHRGSAFGPRVQGQPTQINFENALAIALLNLPVQKPRRLFVEDESRAIGSLSIPQALHGAMRNAPVAMLEESLEQRVSTILNDYIFSNYTEFKLEDPENYQRLFSDYLLNSLHKIKRRLGDDKFQPIKASMEQALLVTESEPQAHREWIQLLLRDYYDPMYDYQLSKKASRIVFRGDRSELLRWAAHLDVPATGAGS